MRNRIRTSLLMAGGPMLLAAGWLCAQSGPTTAPGAPSKLSATSGPSGEPRPVLLYVQESDAPPSPARPFFTRAPYYGGGYPQPQPVADAVQIVSCVLQVDTDGSDGARPDSQSATALATSTVLLDAAAEKAMQLKPEQRRQLVVVNAYPAGYRFTKLEVALRPSDTVQYKPTAAPT